MGGQLFWFLTKKLVAAYGSKKYSFNLGSVRNYSAHRYLLGSESRP